MSRAALPAPGLRCRLTRNLRRLLVACRRGEMFTSVHTARKARAARPCAAARRSLTSISLAAARPEDQGRRDQEGRMSAVRRLCFLCSRLGERGHVPLRAGQS